MVLLVAPLVFRAPEGPAAREARASLRSAPRLEARPCPPVPPAPSTPVGPGCFVCPWAAARPRAVRAASLRLGASSRSPVRPRRPINFARNSPAACSSIEFVSLELQCFWGVSKNDRDKSRATFGCRWCRLCPWAPQSGPVGQLGRSSETVVAFAGVGRASAETVVAFAGEKWAFWVRFSVAEVMVVSMVAVQGRAVVMVVSMPPSCRASCAKKFALHARNTPKSAFLRLLGELFRGRATGGAVLGEFFRGNAVGGAVRGEFFRANRPCAQVL